MGQEIHFFSYSKVFFMNEKIGRNDPCPCGSGKKYKNCCLNKATSGLKTRTHKITAKWLNQPQAPNLIERTFGEAISSTGKIFEASNLSDVQNKKEDKENQSEA